MSISNSWLKFFFSLWNCSQNFIEEATQISLRIKNSDTNKLYLISHSACSLTHRSDADQRSHTAPSIEPPTNWIRIPVKMNNNIPDLILAESNKDKQFIWVIALKSHSFFFDNSIWSQLVAGVCIVHQRDATTHISHNLECIFVMEII